MALEEDLVATAGRVLAPEEEVEAALVECVNAGLLPYLTGGRVFGRAFMVQEELMDYLPDPPYVGPLESLGRIAPGQVYVLATTGGTAAAVAWSSCAQCRARQRCHRSGDRRPPA